jgi:hypothetical protein
MYYFGGIVLYHNPAGGCLCSASAPALPGHMAEQPVDGAYVEHQLQHRTVELYGRFHKCSLAAISKVWVTSIVAPGHCPTPAADSTIVCSQAAMLFMRNQDMLSAACAYEVLFVVATVRHTTHPDLHVAHSNCAAVFLHLRLPARALAHADAALALMKHAAVRGGIPLEQQPLFPKLQLRR